MDILTAAKNIEQDYIIDGNGVFYEISTGLYDRGFEGISIFLTEYKGNAFLSDGADIANGVGDYLEETELNDIARRFGFELNDWHIQKKYESNDDIYRFIELVMFVQTKAK